MRYHFLFALSGLLLACHTAIAQNPLEIGIAAVDVSPPVGKKPVYMAGFGQNRVATKIHDPIMARAIVLHDGKQKLAMVSVDVVGLFLPFVDKIRKDLAGFDHVMVSATHNHEGPDTMGLWGSSPFRSGIDPDYMKTLHNGIIDAVKKADQKRQSATAKIGTQAAPELIRDTRLPILLHDDVVAISFHDPESNKPIGLLVQWNCHPELLDDKNTEISADHVGYTVDKLEKEYDCPVIYFTGTVGGLMTSLGVPIKDEQGNLMKDGTFEKTEKFGHLVADAATKAVGSSGPVTLTPFAVHTERILVPIDNALYKLAWQAGVLRRVVYLWEGKPKVDKPTPNEDISKPAAVLTEVGYFKLGELDLAVIPGEIYPELVLGKVEDPAVPGVDFPDAPIEPGIYPNMPSKHKMIIGLGNDEIGYIIPKRQWDEKPPFAYDRTKMQYGEVNSVSPEAAPIICESFRDLVRQAKRPRQ